MSIIYANDGPASRGFVVTPADSNFTGNRVARMLYIGGTGHVTVVTNGGDTILISSVPVGTILPVQCVQVKSTGTTATLIVALY
jgi:hypothetical protein